MVVGREREMGGISPFPKFWAVIKCSLHQKIFCLEVQILKLKPILGKFRNRI